MEKRIEHTFDISGNRERQIKFPLIRELFKLSFGNQPNGKNGKLDFLAVQQRINSFKETILNTPIGRSSRKLSQDFLKNDQALYETYKTKAANFYYSLQNLTVEFGLSSDEIVPPFKEPSDSDEYYHISYQIESFMISVSITFRYSCDKQIIVETNVYNFIM